MEVGSDGRKARQNRACMETRQPRQPIGLLWLRAFSGEVDAGSPPENAITQREIERIPILLERNLL
jgi:hypothetical protein